MFTKIHSSLNIIPGNRALRIGLLVILVIAISTGFAWMQMDPVIAPPGVRALDWIWRVFVCRCL